MPLIRKALFSCYIPVLQACLIDRPTEEKLVIIGFVSL